MFFFLKKKDERRLKRAFGLRHMKCTRNPKHTLFNVLGFDLGRMKCTPEFKKVILLESRLKESNALLSLGRAVKFAKRPFPIF